MLLSNPTPPISSDGIGWEPSHGGGGEGGRGRMGRIRVGRTEGGGSPDPLEAKVLIATREIPTKRNLRNH